MSKKKKKIDNDLIQELTDLADLFGYEYIDLQIQNRMISFKKDIYRINIYMGKMTVGVCFNIGTRNMSWYLKNVDFDDLQEILTHPERPLKGSYGQNSNVFQ
jgi:hypothetical protein